MTLDQAIMRAPAIAATHPEPHVSARYTFIPTLPIVERLLAQGWEVHDARQNMRGDPYAMHRVTLRVPQVGDEGKALVGEVTPLAHIYNSHNRTRRITWSLGLYVCICSNQAHVPLDSVGSRGERVHLDAGDGFNVDAFINNVLSGQDSLAADVAAMRQLVLTDDERTRFACNALVAGDGALNADFIDRSKAEQLLVPRRESQRNARDLWTTYNIVQENLIERGRTGRGVHEILRNSTLNMVLWRNATEMLN